MLVVESRFKDHLTKDNWSLKSDIVSSIEECIRINGYKTDERVTDYEIVDINFSFSKPLADWQEDNAIKDEIRKMSEEDRKLLIECKEKTMNDVSEIESDKWSNAYHIYKIANEVKDEIYREENMAEFKAYEAKMHEPDFDWDYYSDWHKDMFGYRPHKEVIPKDEEEREKIYKDFHKERGF